MLLGLEMILMITTEKAVAMVASIIKNYSQQRLESASTLLTMLWSPCDVDGNWS